MSIFEYVVVLLSVVLSLGLARVLETHAQLMKHGDRVKWSPTYLAWLVNLLICHIDFWASVWQVQGHAEWTAGEIGLCLSAVVLLFYAAIFAAPEMRDGEPVDLWEFHLANRRRYLGALMGYTAIGAVLNATLMSDHFSAANLTATGPVLLIMAIAYVFSNRWVQRVSVGALLVLMAIYFAQYLPSIGA